MMRAGPLLAERPLVFSHEGILRDFENSEAISLIGAYSLGSPVRRFDMTIRIIQIIASWSVTSSFSRSPSLTQEAYQGGFLC